MKSAISRLFFSIIILFPQQIHARAFFCYGVARIRTNPASTACSRYSA